MLLRLERLGPRHTAVSRSTRGTLHRELHELLVRVDDAEGGDHVHQAADRLPAQRRALLVPLCAGGLPRRLCSLLLRLHALALERRLLEHRRILRNGSLQQRVVTVVSGGRPRLMLAFAH
eukprot:scaffold5453_cov58-Phaeocystis_antarctica.AAC.5